MAYLGDYAEDYATMTFTFSTRKDTGLPTVLTGSPVITIYKGTSVTGKTSAESYVTLTIDFNSKVGLNHVLVDLSGDAFFATGNDYHVVITTGTVNSISVIGETVATFSIENRFMRGTDSVVLAGPTKTEMDTAHGLLATEAKQDTIDTVVDAIKGVTDLLPDAGALNDLAAILTDTAVIGALGAGLTELGGMSAIMQGQVNTEADSALTDYDAPTKAEMDTAHALLATPAQVNTEVVDVMATDTLTLPGQGAPSNTPTTREAIGWMYKVFRNRKTQTATDWKLYADDGTTVDAKATVADDATTASKTEIVTGP